MTTVPTSLDAALAYENDDIIEAFRDSYDVTEGEARDLFTDVKKWLWLAGTHPSAELPVFGPMTMLDEMWHTFIQFTFEYSQYCLTHFGHYIHHAPSTRADKERYRRRMEEDPEAAAAEARQQRRALMLLVHDQLGEVTLRTWFGDYTERFSDERLANIVIKFRLPAATLAA